MTSRRIAIVTTLCICAGCLLAESDSAIKGSPVNASRLTQLNWGESKRSGPYPLARGLRNVVVDIPDGSPTSLGHLESLQYHHHTRVAVSRRGRIWVAYSGDLHQEGESGMITEVKSSTDGSTWSPATAVILPASRFDGNQASGRRISYPRAFVTVRDQLYLVGAIDQANGEGCCTNEQGEALVAAELKEDGTVGARFRVSPTPYTPLPGLPDYVYDSTLGAAIFKLANAFGTWGGSAPGQPASPWTGYGTAADGTVLVEPNSIAASLNGRILLRFWRDEGAIGRFVLYSSLSKDSGFSWSPATPTNIPNEPSETATLTLANGNIALVGNAIDQPAAPDARDPLFLAVFDGKTGKIRSVSAIRQGLGRPAYDNAVACGPAAKPCGAAYPGAYECNNTLYISYSAYKQQIWLATVPSGNL